MYVERHQEVLVLQLTIINMCYKWSKTRYISRTNFFFFFFLQLLPKCAQYQVKITCTLDRLRSRKALNTNFKIILKICQKHPFDITAMRSRGTFGLCCAHIAELMTYAAVYTLLFTFQLCYKSLGIHK